MGGLAFKQDMFEKVSRKSHKTVEIKRPTIRYWEGVWHRLRQNKLAMTGLIILIIMGIMSIVGTRISGYRYYEQDLTKINQAPNSDYRFGTDELGRDLFSRVWLGTRYSLIIGICAALIDFLIGVLYGGIAGMSSRGVDVAMMRVAEIIYSIPHMLVVILISVVFSTSGTGDRKSVV